MLFTGECREPEQGSHSILGKSISRTCQSGRTAMRERRWAAASESDGIRREDRDEKVLDEMSVYPIVGVTAFEAPKVKASIAQRLFIKADGIAATGYDAWAGFVVTKGS